jgi:hypothetical protein
MVKGGQDTDPPRWGCYVVHGDSVQHNEGEGRVAPFELEDLIPLPSPISSIWSPVTS